MDACPVVKALSNLKAHIKTPNHGTNCQHYQQVIKRGEAEKKAKDDQQMFESHFQEVEKKFKGEFELLKLGAQRGKCRCKAWDQLLSLNPDRGSYMNNFATHKQTCNAAKRLEKRKQASMGSFLTASKKPKTQ